jgi:hypothetical protein
MSDYLAKKLLLLIVHGYSKIHPEATGLFIRITEIGFFE